MKSPRIATAATAGALALSATLIAAGSASAATPPETGCPAGYSLLSLEWLAEQGAYMLPFQLDAAGNNDGLVCGKPLNPVVQNNICGNQCPVPVIYNFYDNTRTPAFKA